jgi:hypothetical protein
MFIIRAALLSLLLCHGPAQAEEPDLNIGSGLVCDTPQQVERFIDIYEGDADSALAEVNSEAEGESVCAIAEFAFVLGPQVGIVKNARGTFRIMQILVIGIFTDDGFEASNPQTFFTVGVVDDESALQTP